MSDSFVPSPLLAALGTSGDIFSTRMAAMLCLLGRIRKQKILPEDVTSSMKSLVIMGYDHKVYSLLEQYGFFSGAPSRAQDEPDDDDEEEEDEEEDDDEDDDEDGDDYEEEDDDDEEDDEEEEIEEALEGSDADDLMKMLPDLSNLDSLSLDELTQTKEMLLGIEQMLAKQQNEVEQLTRQQETMRSYLATRAE